MAHGLKTKENSAFEYLHAMTELRFPYASPEVERCESTEGEGFRVSYLRQPEEASAAAETTERQKFMDDLSSRLEVPVMPCDHEDPQRIALFVQGGIETLYDRITGRVGSAMPSLKSAYRF